MTLARSVVCPVCRAGVGVTCRKLTFMGWTPITNPHAGRRRVARGKPYILRKRDAYRWENRQC